MFSSRPDATDLPGVAFRFGRGRIFLVVHHPWLGSVFCFGLDADSFRDDGIGFGVSGSNWVVSMATLVVFADAAVAYLGLVCGRVGSWVDARRAVLGVLRSGLGLGSAVLRRRCLLLGLAA